MLNKGNACLFNSSVQNFLFMIHSMKFKPQQLSMSSCILLSRSDMEGGSKKCQLTWFKSLDTCCLRSLIIALSSLWVTSVPKKSKPCDGRLWPWPHRGSSMDSLSDFSPYFIPLFSFLSIFSFFFFFLYPSHIFLPDCCFPSLLFSQSKLVQATAGVGSNRNLLSISRRRDSQTSFLRTGLCLRSCVLRE